MQYIFHEPKEYRFKDVNGHHGKFFDTNSPMTNHLIIECEDKLTVSLAQQESEFNYYVLEGEGYFMLRGEKQTVHQGDLIVLPPGTEYSFGGRLKMLLINTPHWTTGQEKVFRS